MKVTYLLKVFLLTLFVSLLKLSDVSAQAPTIASFAPSSGCSQVTPVIITGTNFTGTTSVTFGGTAAFSFTVDNATQITAIPGNGTTGAIAVTNPFGTATSAGTFTVNISAAVPTPVTATPSSICVGSSSDLNAISAGNIINWFIVPSGGVSLGASASGANFSVTPGATTIYYAQSGGAASLVAGTVAQGALTLPYIPGSTPMGVVWNPQFSLYYATSGGSPGTPLVTYNSSGVQLSSVGCNVDDRGSWWNSNTNKFELNSYGSTGYSATDLNGSGWALNTGVISPAGQFQPDGQSMGGYDPVNNETVFYNAGQIQRRNRTTGALIASGAITGLPGGNINNYWAAYSGVPGSEIMIYDYTNRAVRFINRLTFAYSASVQLAASAPQPGSYSVGYDGNGKLWLHNGSAWVHYPIINPGGGGCPSPTRTPVTVTVNPAPGIPTAVTATPNTWCGAVGTSQLNATSAGNTIRWYTAAVGGTLLGSVPSGTNFAVNPVITTTYYAESYNGTCASGTRVAVTITISNPNLSITQSPVAPNCGVNPTLTAVVVGAAPANGAKYYIRDADPWGSAAFSTGLNAVFGAGNWTPLTYAAANPATIFVPGTQFVYLEGSSGTEAGQTAYLAANLPAIEAWVNAGGRLLINRAPNSGAATTNFGFGSVVNNYNNAQGTVNVAAGHPIAAGPFTPAGVGPYTGGSYSHAHITGGATTPIITGGGVNVLTEKTWGNGLVLFGGYTAPSFHSPTPNAQNLFQNWVNYCATSAQGPAVTYLWAPGGAVTPSIVANATGIYTVTATQAGCSTTATISVTITPNPTVTASSPTPVICVGSSATLNATGTGTSYTWNPGGLVGANQTVSPAVSTVYTVTAAIGACTATTTLAISVSPMQAQPSPVTATPSTVCGNVPSQLNAVGTVGSTINWYTVPSGGIMIGTSPSGVNFAVNPAVTTTYYAEAYSNIAGSQTFNYSGSVQNFTVPAGVTSLTINVKGAQGGAGGSSPVGSGGLGANMTGTFSVTPGQVLKVLVGQQGGGNAGTPGAGGGGGSFVTDNSNNPMIIAGGGGGRHGTLSPVGMDAVTTNNGVNGNSAPAGYPTYYGVGGTGGNGATNGPNSPHSGNGGGLLTAGAVGQCGGSGAAFIAGGAGGASCTGNVDVGGFGGGAAGGNNGAGGGGGYSGGGGSYHTPTNGGGGGSFNTGTSPVNLVNNTGNGQVVFSWSNTTCPSAPRVPVTVTVMPPPPVVTAVPASITVCEGTSVTLAGNSTPPVPFTWTGGISDNTPFTPMATTTYTVTGTDGNGCTGTATALVTVNPINTGSGSATPTSFCLGGSTTITGVANSTCMGNVNDFAGFYAPANWSFSVTNSNGTVNTGGAPASIVISSGNNLTGNPGFTRYSRTAGCNGTVTFNWAYTHADAFGSIFDFPQYTINGGAPVILNGFVQGGANVQNGSQSIPVNIGDVLELQMYTIDNDPTQGFVTISSFSAPALGYTGSASIWDSPAGGVNLGASPQVVTPAVLGTVTYYVEITSNGPGNCANPTRIAVPVTVNGPVVTASATPNTTCNMTSVTPNGTGPNLVWSGGLMNGVPFVAMATATYTVTGTDGGGCTATSTVTVTVNPASGILAPATTNQSQDHGDDFNINYYDGSCDLIATVDDGTGGNILGLTTSTVNVDATAGFHNGQPFVRRWYQITPTNNGTADVILYINQSDFDDYNAVVVAPYLPLPTSGNNADPNVANIRITKNDDAGLGNNPIVITPTVNWNGTYWELSFNTPSFSQFRVHSVNPGGVPLPATVTNFSGMKLESSDKLSWTTASEQNNAYFNLQHSTDGVSFSTIAKVNSKAPNGNSTSTLNYSSVNNKPALGHNYYRLQQVDIDQKLSVHAQIVDLIWGANGSSVSIYPNPTTDILNVDLYTAKAANTTVKLLDMSGRVVKQIQAKSVIGMNNIQLSMGEIAGGLYTIQVYENNTLTHTSKVRKSN